jgi:hypothetical protein
MQSTDFQKNGLWLLAHKSIFFLLPEILNDIKHGAVLHADKIGSRVREKNWWLGVFGTQHPGYGLFYGR